MFPAVYPFCVASTDCAKFPYIYQEYIIHSKDDCNRIELTHCETYCT